LPQVVTALQEKLEEESLLLKIQEESLMPELDVARLNDLAYIN